MVVDPRWPVPLRQSAGRGVEAAVADGRVRRGDLVAFTSGSSGQPRGVVRSVESWTASLAAVSAFTGATPDDVVWLPGPLTSTLSLYGAFWAECVGAVWVAGPPTVDVTCAHLVPSDLARACDLADAGRLATLRTVVVAGAALPEATRRRAVQHGWRVVEYYGAAELSFVGWRDHDGPFQAVDGAHVRLDDDGVVWVDSPYVARGYLRADDDGPLRRDGRWASVGDLGAPSRDPGAGWMVVGRGSTAVTTGGATVVVEEVERALAEVPGVQDVAVCGLPHERLGAVVAAVVVPDAGTDPAALDAALRRAVRALPAAARPRRWRTAPALPRTPAGKVDRAALARDLLGEPANPDL